MLRLDHITLVQYRNYLQNSFEFTERVVCICGLNGAGKTNLLDAIYYLSMSKSYFSRPDAANALHGLAGFRLDGSYHLQGELQKLVFILRENNKKELSLNDEAYKKFSDHLGKFPCVMIAPDDVSLISGSSEERRRLIDTILCQLNKTYLLQLIDYTKLLQQRNSLLKQLAENGSIDESLFEVIDQQLCSKGNYIFKERTNFLVGYLQLATEIYTKISGNTDNVIMQYESQLVQSSMEELFKKNQQKDRILQRTSTGIHRDDLSFKILDQVFKTEASQGQRKSLLFALKLAEWQVLKDQKGFTPILLLDDVFEKLDEKRMYQLLNWVCTQSDGQVFITDTHSERLKFQMHHINTQFQLIEL